MPKTRKKTAATGRGDASGATAIDELTKRELYERARRANIQGRSNMSREQLLIALSRR